MFRDPRPYESVAPTMAAWLGDVPRHWRVMPGTAVMRLVKDRNTALRESVVLSLSYGRVVVKPAEKFHGLVPASLETYQVLEPGDVVVRPTDLQNDKTSARVGLVREHGIITSAYLGFRTSPLVEAEFAHLYLASLDAMKVFYGMGSGLRQNLEWSDFKRLPFLLPTLEEQSAIVKYLGHAHARIDKAIVAKRSLIALLEEQKQAVINQAVTRGLDASVPMKDSGVPWIGRMPSHWELRRAKEVCARIVDCKNRTPRFVDGGEYQVVRTTCIRRGAFSLEGAYTTDEADFRTWTERGAPRPGDVFFTREAPTGEAALVPDRDDLCMGQRMMYLRPDPALLDPHYLLHSIYGPVVRAYIDVSRNGSTVGHLRLGQVGSMPILWCPLDEQRAIVEYVRRKTSGMDAAARTAAAEIALLREYRTRLTSDVVTGQLDVRVVASTLPDLVEPGPVDADGDDDELLEGVDEILEEVDA